MNIEKIRHIFTGVEPANSHDAAYIDWFVWESGANSARRLITLTYSVEDRYFVAFLQRSEADDSEFLSEVNLPKKLVKLFVSMLTDEDIAICTRASIAIAS